MFLFHLFMPSFKISKRFKTSNFQTLLITYTTTRKIATTLSINHSSARHLLLSIHQSEMMMIMVHSELRIIRRLGGRVFCIRQNVGFCPMFLSSQASSRRSFSDDAPVVQPLISSCEYQHLRNKIQTIGYGITSTPILSPSTVQAIRDRFKPLFRGEFETNIYPDEWHWRNGISLPTGVTREICNAYKSDLTIARVILSPILAKTVCNVMNWSSVRIAQDDVLWKPPAVSAAAPVMTTTDSQPHYEQAADSVTSSSSSSSTLLNNATRTVVGFHQDSAYISTQFVPYENNSVTVWIALDDATKETGCLEYAPGSHLWQQQQQQRPNNTRGVGEDGEGEDAASRERSSDVQTERQKDDDTSTFHSCNADTYRASLPRHHTNDENVHNDDNVPNIVAAECMTGHAIFHHQDIWHGSGPNQSLTRHRRSLVGHYIRGDVQWKTHDSADQVTPWGSTSYIYGRYRTVGAIDLDESFFPILHAEPESGLKRTAWVDRYIGTDSTRL